MLDEVKQLQEKAVNELVALIERKNEITFKAPTGSGKTHMMADFMDRVLATKKDVVFIVSSLSKAELAKQNYEAFVQYIDEGKFSHLNPYLINSDNGTEGSLFIPADYNVYVLPRDLYKDNSKLKDDATLLKFLHEIKGFGAGSGSGNDIYVIKDECHQATNNLDELSKSFFTKVINFSATPKLTRGQIPDVVLKESDAVSAHLIKNVEFGDDTDTLEDALKKYVQIKKSYLGQSINVNPCMIIQISNKDKADEEVEKIKTLLNQEGFSTLKWMLILDKSGGTAKGSDTNDIIGAKKQPLNKWKDYAKTDNSTIDIIIFKMVITEGWDIRRACMLFQIRDSKSKQLDEQVIGRVRRNPRLLDFEKLDKNSQELISTAYVWGIKPTETTTAQTAILWGNETDNQIQKEVKIQTTRLKAFETEKKVKINQLKLKPVDELVSSSIFDLYRNLKGATNEVQEHYINYVDTYDKFFKFAGNIAVIKKKINDFCCNYSKNMELVKDEKDIPREASFPYQSSFMPTTEKRNIERWVWKPINVNDEFSFDSESEKIWAKMLLDLQKKDIIKTVSVDDEEILLLGKNFLENSEIKYEYYDCGRHFSYPDFVMKDSRDRIHIFEVKSLNVSSGKNIDEEEYKSKVKTLKDFYTAVSSKTPHFYYLPIKKGDGWTVWTMKDGKAEEKTFDDFVYLLKS
ncbi:MAG: DEAD/DEAH box helicase family protein [Bacteroidales bacterium]|nr:DEAD/DEAH box helicase family protein [Bacteroidales bacterium]